MIYITIEGGIVTSVCTDDLMVIGRIVAIIDYDVEGMEREDCMQVIQPNGNGVLATVNETTVERVLIRIPELTE